MVAVEYFSKWIEAKPLATITSVTVQKFFWQNIVCRFGVPKAITVDNGTQFDAETFKELCDQIGTKIHFASVRHPESNGLVERANGIIMTGIMKLIFNQPRGKWPDELIKVVWSHNTTISRSTGFTPFKLLFGDCWGPSSSEGPQKRNLTMSSKHGLWTVLGAFGFRRSSKT